MAYLDKIRNLSAAVAFAEAGEFDTARSMADVKTRPGRSSVFQTLERVFAAAAFAEGGLFKEAQDLVDPVPQRRKARPSFIELVGLQHAPVHLVCVTSD